MSCRITPLSSYDLPCHTPFQTIALPAFQSEVTLVPNMYCLTAAGVTSESQTLVLGALIEIVALAMRYMVSILAPPERRINRPILSKRRGVVAREIANRSEAGELPPFQSLSTRVDLDASRSSCGERTRNPLQRGHHAIPVDREIGREPRASAPGADGRHGQAHRGFPQEWLPDPHRRTVGELDGRTRPGLRREADRDRRAL